MENTSFDSLEVRSDNNCMVTATICNESVMSQKSIDIDKSNMKGTEYDLNDTYKMYEDGDEDYYGDGEETNGEYFEGYNKYGNENGNNGDYYQEYSTYSDEVEYYGDDYYPCSNYGDGVDEITFNNIKHLLLSLIRATMRKAKVLEDTQTFLLSVLGVCSTNQRQQLMEMNIEGNTALSTCCEVGNIDLAKFLVENCNAEVNGLPLIWAIHNSQIELLLHLLQQNADVGACLDYHYSLLTHAVGIMPYDILDLYPKGEEPEDLLYLRSNMSIFPRYGYKCFKPSMEIVEILIEYGIIKKNSDINLFKCLAHCIKTGQYEFFSVIVDAIDEIDNIRDQQGCSILGFAIKMNKLQFVEKLVSKDADINSTRMLKCIKYEETESQTIQSIVNSRWHSLIDSNKSNEDLNIDNQVYVHPIVYCASTEGRDVSYGFGGVKETNLDMLSYLIKLPQIDLEVKLDAVEMLGACYTIKKFIDWNKACKIAFECWNSVTDMRCGSRVMDSCCDEDNVIPDIEIGDEDFSSYIDVDEERPVSPGKNIDEKEEQNDDCVVESQANLDSNALSMAVISHINNSPVEINPSNASSPTETSHSNPNALSPAEISCSNSFASNAGSYAEISNSDSDASLVEYPHFNHISVDIDIKIGKVQEFLSVLNNQEKEMISQKKINFRPRSVFKNKLELDTKMELESLKSENIIEIATQSALLFERLVGYDSVSTIKAFIKLAKLYKTFGDKQQYVTIMIYIIVYFRKMSSCPNRYLNVLRNLAFIVSRRKDLYQLDISREMIITKLFYLTNIHERTPHREFSFLLSAIDRIRTYEKTDDELLDFNSLLRVVVKSDKRDKFGQSHLHYAALLKKDTERNRFYNHYDTDEDVDNDWVMSGVDWMPSAFNGGSLSLTNFFLRYGVNPNTCDDEGMTPLHAVYKVLSESEGLSSESREIVESLVEAGGHFDCMDAVGNTAIDYSQITASPLCPVASRSLQCIASCLIVENNLKYQGQIPQDLVQFVQLHEKRGTIGEKPKTDFIYGNKYKCIFVM